jgi:Transglutaminase-like superfamily
MRDALATAVFLLAAVMTTAARAQTASAAEAQPQRWQFGMIVQATGSCTGIQAAVPVPMDWPEQQVREVDKPELSAQVSPLLYRVVSGGVKLMLITIPYLAAGETATAVVTLEITKRSRVQGPADTAGWRIPAKPVSELRSYLGVSPLIESNHPEIKRLASELVAGQATDWEKVKAIYDGMRARLRYKFDPKLESAVTALRKGEGDCGELTSLFVALCRAQKIPARTVWVIPNQSVQETGHCYPEFYLEDKAGRGRWFPCQAAGDPQFGEIYEVRPILQKGDNFQVSGKGKPLHFAAQTFQARDAKANPRVQWVQKHIELDR